MPTTTTTPESKPPKITVHRETAPITPESRFTFTRWRVRIGGADFATISSVGAAVGSWRCHILDPDVWSGDFYDKQSARAWALEMAQRKLDPSRGAIESVKDEYGSERRIGADGEA